MHFAAATSPQHRGGKARTNEDQQPFELSQYTPLGIQHFSAQYKHDPKSLEKLSRRICARVEQDSSDLITFCDKRIRKRRKKKKQEEELMQQKLQELRGKRKKKYLKEYLLEQEQQRKVQSSRSAAPEVISASDLVLGACLGQGSFSSVFVLEKHLLQSSVTSSATPRRGRRRSTKGSSTEHTRSTHIESISTRSSSYDHSTSNRSASGLRRRLRQSRQRYRDAHDETNDSDNGSCRSRSLSRSRDPKPGSKGSKHYRQLSNDDSYKNKVSEGSISRRLRSMSKKESTDSTRSRSLSSSIRKRIEAYFSRRERLSRDEEDFESRTKSKRSKSHHMRPNCEDSEKHNGFFRGGSRSLSFHGRRDTRRSRSRDNKQKRSSDITCATQSTLEDYSSRDCVTEDSRSYTNRTQDESNSGIDTDNLVVKILQPKLMGQPKLFANCAAGLIREGLFLAAIDHPHVLKVHAWTSPNGWMDYASLSAEGDLYDGYLLVLERLTGGSLKGWMRKWQQDHAEEKRALAKVAAMKAAEQQKKEKSQRRLGNLRRTLSFSSQDQSCESGSFSLSGIGGGLRHTVLKRGTKGSSRSFSLDDEGESAMPLIPGSPIDSDESGLCSYDRQFPYTMNWPQTELKDRMSLLLQLSDTVKYLHKHRILHRDLKPDNLGVATNAKQKEYPSSLSLKIFDFDIARLVPEEPTLKEVPELSLLASSKSNKKRIVRTSMTGSINTYDSNMLCSNRSGRTIETYDPAMLNRNTSNLADRSCFSEEHCDSPRRVKGKKYRGRRPEAAESHDSKDALFEMTGKMGSPRYMAPEIARGERYNLKSEVYTVCLLVHEVLTLQKPYDELAPEDHGQLVHFDRPGYRPPIFHEWNWPQKLKELLRSGFGDISERPNMKEVNSILKMSLPQLCPELIQRTHHPMSVTSSKASTSTSESLSVPFSSPQKEFIKKKRNFFRTPRKGLKSSRSNSLTPTASNSDFSLSNDEPLFSDVAQ